MFAGSGQLGIEALSRGAAYATFTDISKDAVAVIKENLLSTGLHKNSSVVQTDALLFLKNSRNKYDIIFLDPPYGKGVLQAALPYAAQSVNDGGVIICEHPFGEEMPQEAGEFAVYREYKYGKLAITVYRKKKGLFNGELSYLSGQF